MANIVDKFSVQFWNRSFYCTVRFPDGSSQELKSAADLNCAGWQAKIAAAWDAHINPPLEPAPVTLNGATKEQVVAKVKDRGWTAKDLGL